MPLLEFAAEALLQSPGYLGGLCLTWHALALMRRFSSSPPHSLTYHPLPLMFWSSSSLPFASRRHPQRLQAAPRRRNLRTRAKRSTALLQPPPRVATNSPSLTWHALPLTPIPCPSCRRPQRHQAAPRRRNLRTRAKRSTAPLRPPPRAATTVLPPLRLVPM